MPRDAAGLLRRLLEDALGGGEPAAEAAKETRLVLGTRRGALGLLAAACS